MSYDCPQCHSQQTASFEMMHARGTSSGTITASTVTFGGGFGVTNGKFNSQTVLAGQLSPPVAPKMGCGIQILIFFVSMIAAAFISSAIFVGLDAVGISLGGTPIFLHIILLLTFTGVGLHLYNSFTKRKRMPQHLDQLREWSDGMICQRCGYMWIR